MTPREDDCSYDRFRAWHVIAKLEPHFLLHTLF